MDPATLERLLIDQSLDRLEGDARELLRAYLQQDPVAAARSAELEDVAGMARLAFRTERQGALPSFPVERIKRAERSLRIMRWSGRAATLAACVALGVGIGSKAIRAPSLTSTGPQLVQVAESKESDLRQVHEFWSARRVWDRAGIERRQPAWSWRTPMEKPTLKGAT